VNLGRIFDARILHRSSTRGCNVSLPIGTTRIVQNVGESWVATQKNWNRWTTRSGDEYECVPAHRNGSPGKSQWAIPQSTEAEIFESSPTGVVELDDHRWGLHAQEGVLQTVGTKNEFLCHFLGDAGTAGVPWHGFPASRWPYDRPPADLLNLWVDEQLLNRATRRKLMQGVWWL